MNVFDIESLLREIPKYRAEIIDIELLIEEAESDISLSGLNYNEKVGATNKFNSETENKALELVEKIKLLKENKKRLELKLNRITNSLNCLDNFQKELIEMKYIKNMKYWEIANTTGKSDRQLARIMKNALRRIIEILGKRG